MANEDGPNRVRAFAPTGNEPVDVRALYELLDQLGDTQGDPDVRRELISIFERHPEADLGSPGPIVHSLEKAPLDEHAELLAASLRRRATAMTVWMAERCFRGELSERSRAALLDALQYAQQQTGDGETADMIADALEAYGD